MARVLIVEPVDEIRTLLALIVAQLGHQAEFLDDRPEVDVAVIEPVGDGIQIAAALRRFRPDLPIVFVSTELASPETRALAPVRHVVKPFERAELRQALEAALAPGSG